MRFKTIILALLVGAGASLAGAAPVQNNQSKDNLVQEKAVQEQRAVDPQAKGVAQNLIEEALRLSHAEEIFAALRRTLSEVYIPVMRALVQGDFPGAPESDAVGADALAKILTFMDYLRKAGDELDAALSEDRSAMISDAAEQIAKSANASDLTELRRVFELPATRKTLDAINAASKLLTGFSLDDSRTFSEFSAWARSLNLDIAQVMPGNQDSSKPVPSGAKVRQAQRLVNDFVQMSHLDEVISDAQAFARDVYAETAPLSSSQREKLRRDIEQYEFMYSMQKAIVIGLAPAVVAASLTDEQLNKLSSYLHKPAFVKAFDLLRDTVKASTAYTKDDILEAQKLLKDFDERLPLGNPEERARRKAEWTALIDKWTAKLKDRLSPETRQGLEQSIENLDLRDSPM